LKSVQDEDWDRVRSIRDVFSPYEELRSESGTNNEIPNANNVPAVKYGMYVAGLYGGFVRAPLSLLGEKNRTRVQNYYHLLVEASKRWA